MAEDTEAKHGGNNGKKAGLSGSSVFTWFMVIALLGVWTSVAVVWFDLVDYEDVLAKAMDFHYNLSEVLQGKLDAYDTDGDGDFDIDDAKVLLGFSSSPVEEKAAKAPDVSRGTLKTKSKDEVKEGIREQLKRVKEKYLTSVKEARIGEKEKSSKVSKDRDQKRKETEKPKKDSGKENKDQEKAEPRRKKDDKPKEITKRTTSGRISNDDRDKKTDKKADKKQDIGLSEN
ncbi:PREDICTED: aspartyl/asparaginyl beta-hydroxylase-like [Nanorana parkeri]|uniref:aspartyl/asparaginyl beta-hydroxylase-like n=1 Tax=Nanorana parkeri TaxID=125878 RepID=UPI000854342F|nr:PREDICTED: aspartyl/asparaginyl beta-hydroxylase-like [Nanorana parkeri]